MELHRPAAGRCDVGAEIRDQEILAELMANAGECMRVLDQLDEQRIQIEQMEHSPIVPIRIESIAPRLDLVGFARLTRFEQVPANVAAFRGSEHAGEDGETLAIQIGQRTFDIGSRGYVHPALQLA